MDDEIAEFRHNTSIQKERENKKAEMTSVVPVAGLFMAKWVIEVFLEISFILTFIYHRFHIVECEMESVLQRWSHQGTPVDNSALPSTPSPSNNFLASSSLQYNAPSLSSSEPLRTTTSLKYQFSAFPLATSYHDSLEWKPIQDRKIVQVKIPDITN